MLNSTCVLIWRETIIAAGTAVLKPYLGTVSGPWGHSLSEVNNFERAQERKKCRGVLTCEEKKMKHLGMFCMQKTRESMLILCLCKGVL